MSADREEPVAVALAVADGFCPWTGL